MHTKEVGPPWQAVHRFWENGGLSSVIRLSEIIWGSKYTHHQNRRQRSEVGKALHLGPERLVQVLALPLTSWETLEKILDLSTASSVKLRDGTHLTVLLWGLNDTTNVTILDSGSVNVNYLFQPPPLPPQKKNCTDFVGNQQQGEKSKHSNLEVNMAFLPPKPHQARSSQLLKLETASQFKVCATQPWVTIASRWIELLA